MNERILKSIRVSVYRSEANFDRACSEANRYAINEFQIDECGHTDLIDDWERSDCHIRIKFSEYIREGEGHIYLFDAFAVKTDED